MKISEFTNLSGLEKKLKFLKTAGNLSLVAKYNLSEQDQITLTEMIHKALHGASANPDYQTFNRLLGEYPFCCLTQMVYHIIFSDTDEFWQPWANGLGIPVDGNTQSRIGQRVIATIQELGFYYDDELSELQVANKYVRPLTSLAGIPNYALDKLFDAVNDYPQQYYDPAALRSELIGWKSYSINRVTERYLKKYPDDSVTLLLHIYDMLQSVRSGQPSDLDDRIFAKFSIWQEAERVRSFGRRHGQTNIPLPILRFSENGPGVCLQMPSVQSRNEYSEYILWTVITDDGKCFERREKLFKRAEGLQTKERTITVPPCNAYTVSLYEDLQNEKLLDGRKIPCLDGREYLLFDRNGRKVTDPFLPDDFGYLIIDKKTSPEFRDMSHDEIILPEISSHYRAYYFSFSSDTAQIRLDSPSIVLKPHANVKTDLIGSEYLFGEKPKRNMLPLLTLKPQLYVEVPDSIKDDLSVQIKHLQSGKYCALNLENSKSVIALDDAVSQYGVYDIRFYSGSKFLKRLSFGYIPDVPFSDQLVSLPAKGGFIRKSGFRFDSSAADISILSNYAVVSDYAAIRCWKSVWVESGEPCIRGQLSCDCGGSQYTFEWEKTIHAVSWSIWDEDNDNFEYCSKTYSIALDKYIEKNLWLSIWLDPSTIPCGYLPSLELFSSDANSIQRQNILCNANGSFSIPLRVFADTLSQIRLPANIDINISDRRVTLIHITDTVELPNLKYQLYKDHDGTAILSWDQAGCNAPDCIVVYGLTNPDFSFPISLRQRNANPDGRAKVLLKKLLPAGVYKIGLPSVVDDLFETENRWRPQTIRVSNIFVVSPKAISDAIRDLDSLLQSIMLVFAAKDKTEYISKLIRDYCSSARFKVSVSDITPKLLASLLISYGATNDAVSKDVMRVIDLISRIYLSNSMRAEISNHLLEYDMNTDELKICFRRLNLFLSNSNNCTLSPDTINKIGKFNEELELLWMLRQRLTEGLMHRIKMVIGADVLRESVRFFISGTKDAAWDLLLEKLFEDEQLDVVFIPNDKVCGRSEGFHSMIEWGERYQNPWINFDKRPDDGIYFCGQTFYDIVASWWLSYDKNREEMNESIERLSQLYQHIEHIAQEQKRSGSKHVQAYIDAMESRNMGTDSGVFSIFYYCGIATLVDTLYYHNLINYTLYRPAADYLIEMMSIFPDLVKRDLLLAELMMFINRRKN